jgi:hypothetical protein
MEDLIPREWYTDSIRSVRLSFISGCLYATGLTIYFLFQARHASTPFQRVWIPVITGAVMLPLFAALSFYRPLGKWYPRKLKSALDSAYDDALSPAPDQHAYLYRLTCRLERGKERVPGILYLGSDEVVFVPNNIAGPRFESIRFGSAQGVEFSISQLPNPTGVRWLTGRSDGAVLQLKAGRGGPVLFAVPRPTKTIELLRNALLQLSLNLQHPPRQ